MDIDDLDFAKEPIGFRHAERTTMGYSSLNAILAKQHDGSLWAFVSKLQPLIARRCTDLKLPIFDSPYTKETGLFVYSAHTLHCTLFNDVALQQQSYNDVSKLNVDGHPWLTADPSSLSKLEVVPAGSMRITPPNKTIPKVSVCSCSCLVQPLISWRTVSGTSRLMAARDRLAQLSPKPRSMFVNIAILCELLSTWRGSWHQNRMSNSRPISDKDYRLCSRT